VHDPVLDAHRVLPNLYTIGGSMSPISIRDQMLRGSMVVSRLIRYRMISPKSGLLVIGAGAGGAVAALTAALNTPPIPTHLVDKGAKPFELQRRASTRYLDPTQYDWALDHWATARFPWSRSHLRMPLPFQAAFGDTLAMQWELSLNAAVAAEGSRLRFDGATEVITIDPDAAPPLLRVTFAGKGPVQADYGTIIWAGGAGREGCRVHHTHPGQYTCPVFEGAPFWSTDQYALDHCGLGADARVLIIGGGDGALQDYLRVITQGLRKRFGPIDSPGRFYRWCAVPARVAMLVQSAEDRAHRARIWVSEDEPHRTALEQSVFTELHNAHTRAVEIALEDPDVSHNLGQLFDHKPPSEVSVVCRTQYFNGYYGLNRFVAR
jgi:hypothetical protein